MRIVIAAFLLALGVLTQAQARGPYGSIKVAGWSGGAYTDDHTGEFSNCIASANYKSGINFGVLVTKNVTWALAFSHPNWSLTPGQKIPIVLSFDGRNTFNVNGVAMAAAGVIVPMPDNSDLVKSFRAARTMSAFAQGNLFQFNLNGTSVLLPALVTCVKTINSGGLAAAMQLEQTAIGVTILLEGWTKSKLLRPSRTTHFCPPHFHEYDWPVTVQPLSRSSYSRRVLRSFR
jgi:hypothetical protein